MTAPATDRADDATNSPGAGHVLRAVSLGQAWLQLAAAALAEGRPTSYDGLPIRELIMLTVVVDAPDPGDAVIAEYADPERLSWMHANFTDHTRVAELGDADSYATRLFDYARTGRDQIAWVIDRLAADPLCRSATITTFQPLTDTTYIPCVSLLDFWLENGAVQLAVYAHSIDFGAKGYGNLVELAELQRRVAGGLGGRVGELTMIVKSAHVYESEVAYLQDVLTRRQQG